MFSQLPAPAADPLHVIMARFRADPREDKIDLGVGVFRAADGISHIFSAVRQAEQRLAEEGRSKAYLSLAGDPAFLSSFQALVFGQDHVPDEIASIQATGGTGALRLGLDLVARAMPTARVHLGLPSWPNHAALVRAAGLELVTHRYLTDTGEIDTHAVAAAAAKMAPGDVFILHGPCHNPSGLDLPRAVRDEIIAAIVARGGLPFIDAAYCGLAEGLDSDLLSLRRDIALAPRTLVAVSCSKSFGLYRERTAMLSVRSASHQEAAITKGHLEELSRSLVSMPPAHGAAVVAMILDDPELRSAWQRELEEHRQRTLDLRSALQRLADHSPALLGAQSGRGIFMLLPIEPGQVGRLERENGIYLPASGRINITGLKTGDPVRLAEALTTC